MCGFGMGTGETKKAPSYIMAGAFFRQHIQKQRKNGLWK
jgi:hypothetical protein